MRIINKIVDFDKYCNSCRHFESADEKDPCHECLNNPSNVDSRKPVMYEKK